MVPTDFCVSGQISVSRPWFLLCCTIAIQPINSSFCSASEMHPKSLFPTASAPAWMTLSALSWAPALLQSSLCATARGRDLWEKINCQTPPSVQFSCSVQFSLVAWSSPTLCDPMNSSTPGLPVHHHLPEFTQTHVHRVGDAIQPSHLLLSPSPPAPNPSQHQGLFQ